ncbi:MAG: hypothetical protein H7249_00720 [Chitinophagaceae bacterium]|nr:hypothetical protein [Oligoflexus sp.]
MNRITRVALWALAMHGLTAQADQFHYSNLVVGERAMGLGGAFTAVADDASALVYNPAGLGFALSNDLSGSANAFYQRKVTYKKTIGNQDFTEKSSGTLAPFFGGLQKLDNVMPGLAVAFGLFANDSELKDQNDTIENYGSLERFHRTANVRGSTTGIGFAAAKRVLGNLSIGAGLSYLMIDELTQEYQDVKYKSGLTCVPVASASRPNWPVCTGNGFVDQAFLEQNTRFHLGSTAMEFNLGAQLATGSWSFGLTTKIRKLITDKLEYAVDSRTNIGGASALDNVLHFSTTPMNAQFTNQNIKDPLKTLPSEIRGGVAWFPSSTLLWTFDTIHYTAAISDNYHRDAVTNFATGAEYYITPSIPIRAGLFTNYDARPKVQDGKSGQPDHIDYMGYSLFGGWVQPNSQVAGGVVLQTGSGKAQKTGDATIQSVEALSYTFAISATHSF